MKKFESMNEATDKNDILSVIFTYLQTSTTTSVVTSPAQTEIFAIVNQDVIFLTIITVLGIFGNLLICLIGLAKKSMRTKRNIFLIHHSFINLIQSCLCLPFLFSLLTNSTNLEGCEIFGGTYSTLVTTGIINIAAIVIAEAYYFEDVRLKSSKQKNKSKIRSNIFIDSNSKKSSSYQCIAFGMMMIWLTSLILHLGITMISSDPKSFYTHEIRNCFFIIEDRRTYVLYIMWVIVTILSVLFIIKYVIKLKRDILKHKYLIESSYLKRGSVVSRNKDVDILNSLIKNRLHKSNKQLDINYYDKRWREIDKTRSLPSSYTTGNNLHLLADKKKVKPKIRSISLKNLSTIEYATDDVTYDAEFREEKSFKTKYKCNYDMIKQILQKIQVYTILVIFFILCWMPLFITVILGSLIEIPPIVYKYLTMIACTNSSMSPYFFITILIPKLNKFCIPCLRSDGKQNIEESKLYDAITCYYDKIGGRFSSINASNHSINSIILLKNKNKDNSFMVQNIKTFSTKSIKFNNQIISYVDETLK
jgi:hypothetical protein